MGLVRNPKHVRWAVRLAKAKGVNLYFMHDCCTCHGRCQHGRGKQCKLCLDEAVEIERTEPEYYVRTKND